MKLVGSDIGRYEQELWTDAVTIAPAERYIVDVLFEEPGIYPFMHESPAASYQLGTIEVGESEVIPILIEEFNTLRINEDIADEIEGFREYFDKPIDKTLLLTIDMSMDHGEMDSMMDHHDDTGIEWEDSMPEMNAMMTGDQVSWKLIDEESGKENMDIHWKFAIGDVVKVRIKNLEDSAHPMQHPVHFHGQRFLVLSMDGKPNEHLVWKDTVLMPTGSTADILIDMNNPGKWMFHCHIAEHLTNGMMGMFTVE
jgi:FtsP/CotA-like multicopper oxidase with cupredoxin domain